jgi:ubiquinone/menaquinone biosynthesis C-methylase UbiE
VSRDAGGGAAGKKGVHDAAARGFQAVAGEYERARPDYPAEAVDRLIQELEVGRAARVLDIGAGTGKLTRMLMPTGARLVGLDPVEAMRRTLAATLPGLPVVGGTAEAMPFRDEAFDAVVAAQAFHWFEGEAALQEAHRVLKQSGRLGLLWNLRDETEPWVSRLTEIIDRYESGAPRERTGRWRQAFSASTAFGTLHRLRFRHQQRLDREGLVERVASMSFIAILPPDHHQQVLDEVRRLADEVADDRGQVLLPYNTDLYWCAKA